MNSKTYHEANTASISHRQTALAFVVGASDAAAAGSSQSPSSNCSCTEARERCVAGILWAPPLLLLAAGALSPAIGGLGGESGGGSDEGALRLSAPAYMAGVAGADALAPGADELAPGSSPPSPKLCMVASKPAQVDILRITLTFTCGR